MPVFVAGLIAFNAVNLYGSPPANIQAAAIAGEVAYCILAAIAMWLDRSREPATIPDRSIRARDGVRRCKGSNNRMLIVRSRPVPALGPLYPTC